jgi:hypothetical protein
MLISNSLMPAVKIHEKMHKNKNSQNFAQFFGYSFFSGHLSKFGIKEFEISIKFYIFFIPILMFYTRKLFGS